MKSDLFSSGQLYNWLHDLAVALGLIPPPLQPVPIPTEDDRRRQKPRR
ncbi:PA1414 family protein [Pseudomonas sp. HR96]|nr:PA1414 family protein [Pseudomonas sp. HR96]WPP01198.1 PA1414 family protein [Pseudomonas sp. HR96]